MNRILKISSMAMLVALSPLAANPADSVMATQTSFCLSSYWPTPDQFNQYAINILNTFEKAFESKDLLSIIQQAEKLLDQNHPLTLEEKRAAIINIFDIIIDNTDTPYLPDFIFDPIFKALVGPIVDVVLGSSSSNQTT